MALSMRLSRGGSKKRPYYRIVVADARSPRDGRFIEKIGTYNPLLAKDSPERVKLDAERAKHWIGVGAQPTDRVLRFLDAAGVQERAARSNPKKGEPGEKAKERAEERATKEAERAEVLAAASAAPEPEPEAEPEAVAEQAPVEAAAEAETVDTAAEVVEAATPDATNEGVSSDQPAEGDPELPAGPDQPESNDRPAEG